MFSKSFRKFTLDHSGASAVEYAMVAGLIVVVSVGAIRGLSATVNTLLASSADRFTTKSDSFGPSAPQGSTLAAPEECRLPPPEEAKAIFISP